MLPQGLAMATKRDQIKVAPPNRASPFSFSWIQIIQCIRKLH